MGGQEEDVGKDTESGRVTDKSVRSDSLPKRR
jgi:hypothetical protein